MTLVRSTASQLLELDNMPDSVRAIRAAKKASSKPKLPQVIYILQIGFGLALAHVWLLQLPEEKASSL